MTHQREGTNGEDGHESRPTRPSSIVATTLILFGTAVIVAASGSGRVGALGALGGVCIALAVFASREGTLGRRAIASVSLTVGAGGVVGAVGLAFASGGSLALVVAGVSALGVWSALLVPAGAFDPDALVEATGTLTATAIPIALVAGGLAGTNLGVLSVALDFAAARTATVRGLLLDPSPPGVVTFLALVIAAIHAVGGALQSLPVTRIVPEEHAEAIERILGELEPTSGQSFLASLLLLVSGLLHVGGGFRRMLGVLPIGLATAIVAITTDPTLRLVLLWLSLLGGMVVIVVRLGRWVRSLTLQRVARQLAPATGGILVMLAVGVGTGGVLDRLGRTIGGEPGRQLGAATDAVGETALVLGLVTAGLVAFVFVLYGGVYTLLVTVVPRRGTASATGAASVFAGAITLAAAGKSPWIVFVGIGIAVLIRDIGEFAVGLGEEVGRGARSTHVELVHLGGSLAVGIVAVGATASLGRVALLRTPPTSTELLVLALFAALAGILLLFSVLRG